MNISDNKISTKQVLVLARNEPTEAMRVAAGLTIFGHEIELIFMHRALTEAEANSEQAELLELCEIESKTTVTGMQIYFNLLDAKALAALIMNADMVINL